MNINTDLSHTKYCTTFDDKESASDLMSKGSSSNNSVTTPNSRIPLYVTTDDNRWFCVHQ